MDVKVSIITVCYNAQKEIVSTIQSVLSQEFNDYEYIVQDGASQDDTMKIVKAYEKDFLRKKINYELYSQHDNGIYDAMNIASLKARGSFLIFLNAGDTFAHEKVLNKFNAVQRTQNADVYFGDAIMNNRYGVMLFEADLSLIKKRMPFTHQACFIKRSIFLSEFYDCRYRICGDYDLILRLYDRNCIFIPLNTIVCIYDMNGISSTQFLKKRKEHEDILSKNNLNNNFRKNVHLLEAYIKEMIYSIMPCKILEYISRLYMSKIKHYKYWDGDIY